MEAGMIKSCVLGLAVVICLLMPIKGGSINIGEKCILWDHSSCESGYCQFDTLKHLENGLIGALVLDPVLLYGLCSPTAERPSNGEDGDDRFNVHGDKMYDEKCDGHYECSSDNCGSNIDEWSKDALDENYEKKKGYFWRDVFRVCKAKIEDTEDTVDTEDTEDTEYTIDTLDTVDTVDTLDTLDTLDTEEKNVDLIKRVEIPFEEVVLKKENGVECEKDGECVSNNCVYHYDEWADKAYDDDGELKEGFSYNDVINYCMDANEPAYKKEMGIKCAYGQHEDCKSGFCKYDTEELIKNGHLGHIIKFAYHEFGKCAPWGERQWLGLKGDDKVIGWRKNGEICALRHDEECISGICTLDFEGWKKTAVNENGKIKSGALKIELDSRIITCSE